MKVDSCRRCDTYRRLFTLTSRLRWTTTCSAALCFNCRSGARRAACDIARSRRLSEYYYCFVVGFFFKCACKWQTAAEAMTSRCDRQLRAGVVASATEARYSWERSMMGDDDKHAWRCCSLLVLLFYLSMCVCEWQERSGGRTPRGSLERWRRMRVAGAGLVRCWGREREGREGCGCQKCCKCCRFKMEGKSA